MFPGLIALCKSELEHPAKMMLLEYIKRQNSCHLEDEKETSTPSQ